MLIDARGVEIRPNDTAIWGFGVGRSIAMAEGLVLPMNPTTGRTWVSATATGRVRIRVTRRSFDSGEKPIVDVAPNRLIILKSKNCGPTLPESPLPTQADEARAKLEESVANYVEGMKAKKAPSFWVRPPFLVTGADAEAVALAEYLAFCARELSSLRRKLRDLDG